MTNQSKAALQALFEQGDVPTGANYADLIDSSVNLAETSAQTMIGPLITTELVTPRVSATNINVTGTFSAANGSFNNVATTEVSASGTVYASAMRSQNGVFVAVGTVSALGSTQATAALLVNVINRGAGVVDGVTTGFGIPANRTGLTQVIVNGGASANLWPPVGGQINALSVNNAFAMASNTPYTIFHVAASAYAVK